MCDACLDIGQEETVLPLLEPLLRGPLGFLFYLLLRGNLNFLNGIFFLFFLLRLDLLLAFFILFFDLYWFWFFLTLAFDYFYWRFFGFFSFFLLSFAGFFGLVFLFLPLIIRMLSILFLLDLRLVLFVFTFTFLRFFHNEFGWRDLFFFVTVRVRVLFVDDNFLRSGLVVLMINLVVSGHNTS